MSQIRPFPHRYTVELAERRLTAPGKTPIAAGAPVQFGGTEEVWSPEELLVASALECLWTTFEAYARHEALEVQRWASSGTAVLEKGHPVPVFSSITLHVELAVSPGDVERARKLLDTAEQRCIVTNALKVPIVVDANVGGQ